MISDELDVAQVLAQHVVGGWTPFAIAMFGLSMGGFGALLLAARHRRPGLRAVAAMSPAAWSQYTGGYDTGYWRSVLPEVIAFLGRNLA